VDFFEVLDRVVDLLRSRGRVTYGALKLQFQLDDAQVEILKDELIYAQHLAVDEDGRVLVWRGEEHSTPPSPSPHANQADIIQDDRLTQPSSPTAPPPAPDAERRQLTVMFCDLVGSTALSEQLDPETLREVVRVYQETAAAVIQRYEGHVAQYLGDGLLIYFGYPSAHEDDAVRAVHTGLGILDAMSTVNPRLQSNYGVQLAVRIGVHTGPVVVGEVGGGRRHEQLALGATPNVAARLEGMAPPNTVVISEATYRLVSGYFTSEDLGTHTLRGVAVPIQVYRIIGASGAQTRLEVTSGRGFTPLVGREQEAGLLAERWVHVKEGMGHVVLLSGEAGIGKSRVVEVAKEIIGNEPHTRVECRSSPYYQNTALYPFIDLFQRLLQWHPDDSTEAKVDKLEQLLSTSRLPMAETVPLLAALLSLPLAQERYPTLQLTPQRQRQKTLESLLALVFERAARQPVLFILEDLHWTDPTTLEWLGLLIDQIPTASMLLLLTHRPEFEPPWGVRSYLTTLRLDRLTQVQVETMVERVAEGKRLPAAVMQYLVQQTDGVPLFVEEMTKALLESKVLEDMQDQYELRGTLTSLAVPITLQDSLMARLDRLGTAKGVAQLGATLG
jgi:class 3 adenylate cyclase